MARVQKEPWVWDSSTIIDSHCHLVDPAMGDWDVSLSSAAAHSVGALVAVVENAKQAVELFGRADVQQKAWCVPSKSTVDASLDAAAPDFAAERKPGGVLSANDPIEWSIMAPCIGLHPVQPGWTHPTAAELDEVMGMLQLHAEMVVGVGECGLDYCPRTLKCAIQTTSTAKSATGTGELADQPARGSMQAATCVPSLGPARSRVDAVEVKSNQARVFSAQIDHAVSAGLAVNVHSRQAGHYAIDMLLQDPRVESKAPAATASHGGTDTTTPHPAPKCRALLHAFDGKAKHAVRGASLGLKFSVAACLGRDRCLQKMARLLPMDALCLETDSPALHPTDGKETNAPENTSIALAGLAAIKGIGVEEVAAATTKTALGLFPRIRQLIKAREYRVSCRFGGIGSGGARAGDGAGAGPGVTGRASTVRYVSGSGAVGYEAECSRDPPSKGAAEPGGLPVAHSSGGPAASGAGV